MLLNPLRQLRGSSCLAFVCGLAIFIAVQFYPQGASAAVVFVQVNAKTPTGSATSVSVPFTAAQSAGNLIVVAVGWNDITHSVVSIADSKGNIYTPAVGPTANAAGSGLMQTIYYAKNIAAAAAGSNTVTVTFNGVTSWPDVRILEYSGVDNVTPVDVTAVGTGSSTTSSTAAVTTTNPNDMLFAANMVFTLSTGPGTGFTKRTITLDGDIAEDRMVTATGSYSAAATLNPAANWLIQMVAFRSADSTPPPPDTQPPTPPSNVTATPAGSAQINLAWTASTDNVGVTGYLVERCQGAGCTTFAQIATPAATTFSDAGLSASTSYSYQVRATDAAGNLSGYSNTASATTPTPDTTPPTAPSSLTATRSSNSRINLAWTASTDNVGVTGYLVERCLGVGCSNFAQIATTTGAVTTYGNTGLTANSMYSYRVRANDAAANLSAYSNTATASTDALAPTAPTGLTATATSSAQINLAWTASTDAGGVAGYRVERCQGAGCSTFAQIGTPTTTTFSDTGRTASTSYSYRVRAIDVAGNLGAYSATASATTSGAPDTTPPTAPGTPVPTVISSTQINLTWPAATDAVGVTGYFVESCSGDGCTTFVQVGAPVTTSYSHTGLSAGTSYSYRVRAKDAAGNLGPYSATASATTMPPDTTPPTAPGTPVPIVISNAQINLTWPAATDAVGVTGYLVESCAGVGCTVFAQVGAPLTTSYSHTGLSAGTSYSYRVRATDAAGNLGPYSATASATTLTADTQPPTAPGTPVPTVISGSQINLTWAAATDNVAVTGYLVERCAGAGCAVFAQVGTPVTTSYSDTGLVGSTSYSYRVRAKDAAGNMGPYSATATATTSAAPAMSFMQVTQNVVGSGTSVAAAFNSATTAGNTVIAYAIWSNMGGVTLTDSRGDSFVAVGVPAIWGDGYSAQIFYASSIAGGATTVTATFQNAVSAFGNIYIQEYAGISAVNPVDASATATGAGATLNSGSIGTATPNVLLFGAGVSDNLVTAAGTGFTARSTVYGNIIEDRIVSSVGTYNATATHNGTDWGMQLVAFRAAGGPPPGPDTTPPTAPSSLTATSATSFAQINLAWTAATDVVGVTGYLIERCQGAGCSTFAQIATRTATAFLDTAVSVSTSYSYRVRATDAAGNLSPYSNTVSATTSANQTNPVIIENQQTGSNQWQLGDLYGRPYASDAVGQIKGYASATSVNKGDNITFHVSVNPAQTYTVDVYRIGWYQGLGGRLMQHIGPLNGAREPTCPTNASTGMIECNWSSSYTLDIQAGWTSGIYLAVLKNAQGFYSYIVFAVRDDSRVAALLYQQSVTTYQANNNYPDDNSTGKSTFENNSYGANTVAGTPRAVKVSFDRPYAGEGAGNFLFAEINLVRWIEKSGYDVAYSTDVDTHTDGYRLFNYRGFISPPHDEFFSKSMYDTLTAARDAGVNIGFFGANAIYWQVRFEASTGGVPNRVMVCYKVGTLDPIADPSLKTVMWRDALNRPEQVLMGVMFTNGPGNGWAPYVVTNSNNWVYTGTGFHDGDSVPGIVGTETDRLVSGYPGPTAVAGTFILLSHSPYTDSNNSPDYSNSSIYQALSGAWVFSSGSMVWSWGLDNWYDEGSVGTVDARIQRATANILDRFVGP